MKLSVFNKKLYILLFCFIFAITPILAYAEDKTNEEYLEEAEQRKSLPVETNNVESWPTGPSIGAEAAILMDASTGEVLYAKNIDERCYPASTTKLMACIVAMEHTSLTDLITINQSAIDANDWDGSNMALVAGEQLTIDELLHGILITSANEACNAIAEHVCGSIDGYVDLMNKRATELGCTNTHFTSANGLHDPEHYTTAYDMALMAREFFSYEVLCRLSSIPYYEIPETDLHGPHSLYSKNKLFEGRSYYYQYLIGSKTGYTGDSRQCLVSCAEKDGVRLICVIFKEESPYQFDDTVNLFEYGFNNFYSVNICDNETHYDINHTDFFDSENEVFGSTAPIISMDTSASLMIPSNATFEDLSSSISYENPEKPYFATVNYYYNGYYVGHAGISFSGDSSSNISFSEGTPNNDTANNNTIMVNIIKVIKTIVFIFVLIVVIIIAYAFFRKRFSLYIANRKRMAKSGMKRRRPSKPRSIKRSNTIKNGPKKSSQGYKNKRHDINFDDFNL